MAHVHFINKHIKAGIWHGVLTGAGKERPALQATHLGTALEQIDCTYDAARDVWHVTVPIPAAFIADGVHTIVISDADGATLDSFSIIAGEPLSDDLRAEIELLRGELEILKTSFRRHCAES